VIRKEILEWTHRHCMGSAWLYKDMRKGKIKSDIRKLLSHLHEVLASVKAGEYAVS